MKTCSSCGKEQAFKHFAKRYISKKTGKQLYSSWCRVCSVLGASKEKANHCIQCDKVISKKSTYCQSCGAIHRKNSNDRYEGTIDKQYLVRGPISSTGQGTCFEGGSHD